ncbi:MAG: tellurite resistance/C4-dicarboxylate transporter family protein [Steroidobacteraceae bacterium]
MKSATIRTAVAGLHPAYFGMVMATGIVSIAAHLLGLEHLSRALYALNSLLYAGLWVLYLLRMVSCPRAFFGDFADHLRGPGYFSAIAASGMLGSQALLLYGHVGGAIALWCVSVALWPMLVYGIFTTLTVKETKPQLDHGINGGWLLAVVATQSIAVLSALLASHGGQACRLGLNFLALSMWLWGGMLYIWLMSLMFYRYTFFQVHAGDLAAPYWIDMGAMAISTLAGALLIANAPDAPFLEALHPFIMGVTILYWATGTWWIPMLVALSVWRHVHERYPLTYDPQYWGKVFPLGMYAVSTHAMITALGLDFLDFLPRVAFAAALIAWAATFVGWLRALLRSASARPGG